MSGYFADTSFYVALLAKSDVRHRRAHELATAYDGKVVTSEYVLVELGSSMLCRGMDRSIYLNLVQMLSSDAMTEILPATSELLQAGLKLFSLRPDKDWSLVDCISFVVMQQRGLTDALTADRHFEQAGFRVLLA